MFLKNIYILKVIMKSRRSRKLRATNLGFYLDNNKKNQGIIRYFYIGIIGRGCHLNFIGLG